MLTSARREAARQHLRFAEETLRNCPICESANLGYEFVVDKSPVCACQNCGLLFLNPQPSSPEDEHSTVGSPEQLREVYQANAAERIEHLVSYSGLRRGPLLLVGADDHLREKAEAHGFEVHALTASQFESAAPCDLPGTVEACILFCSLERMRDPLNALKLVRSLLCPSGALMVVSPTIDSKTARLFGASWWEFNRGNFFYFSTDTLQNLLIKAGFGDPMIVPDRTLISLNYVQQQLRTRANSLRRYKLLRALASASPVLRNKAFRLLYGRTRFLVRPKPASAQPLLSILLPVYNERATFRELMEQVLDKSIPGVDIEVIVVESNSNDGTRELVQEYAGHPRTRIILEDRPRGKGHAVRTALAAARGEIILFQDADLEYDLNDYDALIAPILRFESNFVLGSRHNRGKNNWKIRKFTDSPGLAALFNFGHAFFLAMFNALYRQKLTDPFTMFKVFRRDCIWGLSFECNRFDFDYEIVIKLLRKGYKPLELPVNYSSRSINEGKKVSIFRDPPTWIRALLKFRNTPLYGGRK